MVEQFDPKLDRLHADLDRLHGEQRNHIDTLRKEAIAFGVIGLLGIGLAIAGVSLELHMKSSVTETKESLALMQASTEKLKTVITEIHDNVTTQSVDNWPQHTDELAKLVFAFKPGDELVIDAIIGYTHFTESKTFKEQYFKQLYTLVTDSQMHGTVRMLVPDYDTQHINLLKQFNGQRLTELWQKNPTQFKTYCEIYGSWIGQTRFCQNAIDTKGPPQTEEFVTSVMFVENQLCDQLISASTGVKLDVRTIRDPDRTSTTSSHSMWLLYAPVQGDPANGMKRMIFAFPQFDLAEKGYAWKTQDRRLMEMFLAEFDAQFKQQYKITQVTRDSPLYAEAAKKCKGCTR